MPRGNPHSPALLANAGKGRRKGSRNKSTTEFAKFCRAFILDPVAMKKMRQQYRNGELHPSVWNAILDRGWGRAPERIEITGDDARPLRITHEFAPGTAEAVQRATAARTVDQVTQAAVLHHRALKGASDGGDETNE